MTFQTLMKNFSPINLLCKFFGGSGIIHILTGLLSTVLLLICDIMRYQSKPV